MNEKESPKSNVDGLEFAKACARMVAENRAEDVVLLDLRGMTSIADFFVIGTGTSDRQMRAIVDQIEVYGKQVGMQRYGISGYDSAVWRLADYVDVVVHLFDRQRRQYYDLELLWGDAPRVEWQQPLSA